MSAWIVDLRAPISTGGSAAPSGDVIYGGFAA
jgi:hypothetical protein